MNKNKKGVALKEDNQKNSNKEEIKEDYKNKPKEIENNDNKSYQTQINGKIKKDEALKEGNQSNSNIEEVKKDYKNTSKEIENTDSKNYHIHNKHKNQKDDTSQVNNILSIKKDKNPVKIINNNNIVQVQKDAETGNINDINDIKALVPAASKLNKKPKQSRYASTYNRIIKKTEDNTEEINEMIPQTSIQEFSKPGLIGLKNIGATCYMNSTLQCFSNCPSFKNNLLKLYKELESGKDSKYILSFSLAQVLKNLWGHHKH